MTEYETDRGTEYWPGEWVDPDEIEPNDWNPNELSEDEFVRLVQSIEDNGWTMPIVVRAGDNYIIDGEHRWMAAQHIEEDPDLTPEGVPSHYVPVYGISVGEEQAKLATVQHNRVRGEVRVDRLTEYLNSLDDRGVLDEVHERIGVDEETISSLLRDIEPPELPDETMPWEAETEPEVHEGDGDDGEEPIERPVVELHEDRTLSLTGELTEEEHMAVESMVLTLTPTEYERVCEALGSELRAQSLLNLVRYIEHVDPDIETE